jgi:hypothetical protein
MGALVALRDTAWQKMRAVPRTPLLVFGAVLLTMFLLLLTVPTLGGVHSRRLANEASAASRVRSVIMLQDEYTAAHAYSGFACELSQLRPIAQRKSPDYSWEFLTTGVGSGYRFSLAGCGSDANQARVRYQIAAVPIERATTVSTLSQVPPSRNSAQIEASGGTCDKVC